MKVCTDACILGAWYASRLNSVPRILDIGSGTGLQMLMLAQKMNSFIQGIEIEPNAFIQLKQNSKSSPWISRLSVVEGDVRNYAFSGQFDFIISNPPFFEGDLISSSELKNKAKHDSSLTIAELVESIDKNLAPAGSFGLLLPYHRMQDIEREARARGFYLQERLLVKQTPKHDWFRVIAKFGRTDAGKVEEDHFSIRDERNEYSAEFVELLKDYYLHLTP